MTTTKTSQAIASLKDLLLRGEVRPGERLPPEADLAARLDVSRNVLREAVRALVHAVEPMDVPGFAVGAEMDFKSMVPMKGAST